MLTLSWEDLGSNKRLC